ncbi:ROT1 protein [Crepidotus variabilis]|uniref:Protein ROT1 n=1 Tax=Crepidotus variabilis TaxID=179855 RepID=A0A9P6E4U0_9AGAR|nr:ROT1 protein [Crepidotus variabilis]
MILTSLLTVVLATFATIVSAQDDTQGPIKFDDVHNRTTIYGTWSSGSKNVLTGPNFANPANRTFNYPKTTGVSYSFSTDGFYELARYRFNGNGSEPTCITGVIVWTHGTYLLNANGSITLNSFGDGFQQVQDPCAAESNFIEDYNTMEYFMGWRIFQDPTAGYKLHLFQFDGTPVAPLFQISTTPNMQPTRLLRNITSATDAANSGLTRRDDSEPLMKRSSAQVSSRWVPAALGAAGLVVAAVTMGL